MLLNSYSKIYIQDENIKGWHAGLFGKQVQHSCLGTIKSKLKKSDKVEVIDRFLPTTKLCYRCGCINILGLGDRIYKCKCGLEENRDIKAAKTILLYGLDKIHFTNKIPTERRKSTLGEKETAGLSLCDNLSYISMNQEAVCFS